MPKQKNYAGGMLAELAKYAPSNQQPITQAQIDAGARSLGALQSPKAEIRRGRLSAKTNWQSQGSLSATPKGTLTQRAADWAAQAAGGGRHAQQLADKFATASETVNPLSWGSTFGDSAAKFVADPSVGRGVDAAVAGLNVLPVGKAAGVLAHVALPALKKGAARIVENAALHGAEEMVPFRHYSFDPNLTAADPERWGTNPTRGFTPREELSRRDVAPGRTYIGLDDGPKPYGREMGVGPHEYRGKIERSKLYDMAADPDGITAKIDAIPKNSMGRYAYGDNLNGMDRASLRENLIKEAGYKGYWVDNPQIGRVGALFEPHPLEYHVSHAPLEGLPPKANGNKATGPHSPARVVAQQYAKDAGIEYSPPTKYAQVDEDRARRIAAAYDEMPHSPEDPEVQKAYGALIKETLAQHQAMKKAGVKLDFHPETGDPYGNPWNAIKDVRENNKLHVYPTDAGYGSEGITDEMVAKNPMLQLVPGEEWSGKPVRVNDVFRGVHDYFGHAKEGVGFRAAGEENAYRAHAAMYSPDARRALATETRGQNSWLNYGPNGEANRTASLGDTTFADQKIGLMPDWAVYEGNEDFLKAPEAKTSPFVEHAQDAQGNKTITYTAKDGTKVPIRMGIEPDGTAEIAVDQFGTGKNKLGPAEIREAMHGLMDQYPEIKRFGGYRRSGAGAGRVQEIEPRRPALLTQAAAAPQAPAIIQHRPIPEADWGYEPKYTGLKNRPAPQVGFEQTHAMTERRPLSPEDLYGGNIIAGMSDRTRAGGILSSLNGKTFDPIEMQGGQDFMRQQDAAGTGALWASDKGPMTGVLNTVNKLDGPSYFAPFTMGGKGGDYSTMMSDAVLGQLQGTTKKARRAFDKIMRETHPDWAGMEDLDNIGVLRQQLRDQAGMRTMMAKKMDSAGALKMGLPDIGATRQAITDPRLATAPTEAFGNNVGVLSGQRITDPALPHDTYKDQIGGQYLGSMETPIPTNLMFPELFADTMKTGRREDVAYRMKRGVKVQKADQQWLDNIMPWYERERSRGTSWSTPALGSKSD